MEISKTKIKFDSKRKTNPDTIELISLARKQKGWLQVAKIVSSSTRKYTKVNLDEINEKSKAGDTLIIIGKVLGKGEVDKKLRICALGFSASAVEKLKKSKSEAVTIMEEIKKNPKAEGVKILN